MTESTDQIYRCAAEAMRIIESTECMPARIKAARDLRELTEQESNFNSVMAAIDLPRLERIKAQRENPILCKELERIVDTLFVSSLRHIEADPLNLPIGAKPSFDDHLNLLNEVTEFSLFSLIDLPMTVEQPWQLMEGDSSPYALLRLGRIIDSNKVHRALKWGKISSQQVILRDAADKPICYEVRITDEELKKITKFKADWLIETICNDYVCDVLNNTLLVFPLSCERGPLPRWHKNDLKDDPYAAYVSLKADNDGDLAIYLSALKNMGVKFRIKSDKDDTRRVTIAHDQFSKITPDSVTKMCGKTSKYFRKLLVRHPQTAAFFAIQSSNHYVS